MSSLEPIEEIESKKRRTRIENAQRSASYFRTRATQERKDAAAQKRPDAPPEEATDHLDFSSEFTNQDTGLHSDAGQADALAWEDLLEDDEWLEDASEDDEEGGGGCRDEEPDATYEETEEAEEAAPPPPGFGAWNPQSGSFKQWTPSTPPAQKPEPVEKQLGYEWGEVENKSEPEPESGPAVKLDGQAAPEPVTPRVQYNPPPKKLPPRKSELAAGVIPAEHNPATYVPPRPRPQAQIKLAPKGQLEQVEDRIVSAARLLITTPEDEPGYEECIRLLGRFGLGALRLCGRMKVKVAILDEKDFPARPELVELGLEKEELPVDGAYVVKHRTCLIDRRCLLEKPRYFHPALYYFSHALDHAQGGDVFSSRKAAAVRACFEASTENLNGCDFVDELAAYDPVRYFARSVSIYLGRDDCEDPLWTHEDLRDFDRSMFDYLEYLFARFSV